MSTRRAPRRLFVVLVVSTALLASALASPALGALADVDIGGGIIPDVADRAATPQQVKPGNVAGFYLWVKNNDNANLPTFFMKAGSTATPLGAYWGNSPSGPFTNCPINADGQIECAFGDLRSGEELYITAAFTTPTQTSAVRDFCKPSTGGQGFEPTTETSFRCVDFGFGANQGFVIGKNKSRGDIYHWYDFVATDGGADKAAQFPFCNRASDPTCASANTNLLTVFNTTGASKNNPQSTKVVAPPAAFNSAHGTTALAVSDNITFECPTGATSCLSHQGVDFLGQWSDVDVNSEALLGGAFIHVTLTMYGVNPNQIDGVIHVWPTGERVIDDRCPSADGPSAEQPGACFWVSGNGNVATVDIWDLNNGNFRTF